MHSTVLCIQFMNLPFTNTNCYIFVKRPKVIISGNLQQLCTATHVIHQHIIIRGSASHSTMHVLFSLAISLT